MQTANPWTTQGWGVPTTQPWVQNPHTLKSGLCICGVSTLDQKHKCTVVEADGVSDTSQCIPFSVPLNKTRVFYQRFSQPVCAPGEQDFRPCMWYTHPRAPRPVWGLWEDGGAAALQPSHGEALLHASGSKATTCDQLGGPQSNVLGSEEQHTHEDGLHR